MTSHNPRPAVRNIRTAGIEKQEWTAERIRALGTVTSVATAASIFGISRSTAYDLVKHGRFPLPVLRFGDRYRVPVAPILKALQLPAETDEPPHPEPPNPT